MMQKLWQKKLDLVCSKEVIDIVQFGSSLIEGSKANDADIVVIFQKIPIKEQLEESQKIKKQLQKYSDLPIHINSFDLYGFFNKSNFSREGILFYGKSLISKDYFSKIFDLNPRLQISYSLKKLKKKDKIKFNYMLNGRGGNYGLLRKFNGKLIAPGIIEVFPEHEDIFLDSIKKLISDFKLKKVFYS